MRMTFEDLGIGEKLILLQDGLQAVNYFHNLIDKLVDEISQNFKTITGPYYPVQLLLLDMRMPMLSGLQVLMRVKEKFAQAQKMLDAILKEKTLIDTGDEGNTKKESDSKITLVRPLIAYLSQIDQYKITQKYFGTDDMAECFLSKPLPTNELEALMKLIKII